MRSVATKRQNLSWHLATPGHRARTHNMARGPKRHLKRVFAPPDVRAVHYLMLRRADETVRNAAVERCMSRIVAVIEMVRVARDRRGISTRKPVKEVIVIHRDPAYVQDLAAVQHYIKRELDAFSVILTSDERWYVARQLEPNHAVLCKRLKKDAAAAGKTLTLRNACRRTRFARSLPPVVMRTAATR